MKFEIGRRSLRIEADKIRWTALEEAYIEDVLGLKKEGDAIALVRKTECKHTFFLETAPLDEHVGEIVVTEEKVCRWKHSRNLWICGCCEREGNPQLLYLPPTHSNVNFCPNCGGRIVVEENTDAKEAE